MLRGAVSPDNQESFLTNFGSTYVKGIMVHQKWVYNGESAWAERQIFRIHDPEEKTKDLDQAKKSLSNTSDYVHTPIDPLHKHFRDVVLKADRSDQHYARYEFPAGQYPRLFQDDQLDRSILLGLTGSKAACGYSIYELGEVLELLK